MLIILAELVEAMLTQAKLDHPIETCGIIASAAGLNRPTRLIPMRNAAQSSEAFRFDAMEQLRVWKDMETRGEEPLVLYHSHTGSAAYPSKEDVVCAPEPHAHYVIVSTHATCLQPVRSFRIVNGCVVEETIKKVHCYDAPSTRAASFSSLLIKEFS